MRELLTINTTQAQQLGVLLSETEAKAIEILGVKVSLQIGSHRIGTVQTGELLNKAMDIVAAEYNAEITGMIGGSRMQCFVQARQMFWLISYELLNVTYNELGKVTGGRDHTTIMYGIKAMRQHIEMEEQTRTVYNLLKQKINRI